LKQLAVLAALTIPLLVWWVTADRFEGAPSGGGAVQTPQQAADAAAHASEVSTPPASPAHSFQSVGNRSLTQRLVAADNEQPVEWKIPSGLTNVQIAKSWEERGFGTAFEFLEALNDPRVAGEFQVAAPMTEGWILSGTYRLPKRTLARTAVRMLLSDFRNRTDDLFRESASKYPDLSEAGMLTLASIIEKESRDRADRRRVSSVYHNRLRQGMRLEADPTLAFALGYPDRMLRNRDRWVQSPHNTYKNRGLPPAPICNVSLDSLRAAVRPVEAPYLFFVSMGNGRHYYSRTYREHLEAIERYRSRRLANAR
jgi:UPF0755 protein